ncbi:MAG: RidA family protein [Aeromicrobium sp.]
MSRISSGAPWEELYGYSRAVVAGPALFVAGTTATVEGGVVGVGDPYLQAVTAFGMALEAVRAAGFRIEDVVRTRMFVADISDQAEIGRAHKEFFDSVRPAATMVQVSGFAHPDHLIEVEIDAYRRP